MTGGPALASNTLSNPLVSDTVYFPLWPFTYPLCLCLCLLTSLSLTLSTALFVFDTVAVSQTFCYAPIFIGEGRFANKLVLYCNKKQFQVLLRIFYLPWSNGFGFTIMCNRWLLGKCPILVTLASNLGHFAFEIEPKIHEIIKLELKN